MLELPPLARNRFPERLKTDDSEAPVPLTDLLADCLRNWHRETMYGRPTDWIFASTRSKGQKPRSSRALTFDHLRPAAAAARVKLRKGQRFGFHDFRRLFWKRKSRPSRPRIPQKLRQVIEQMVRENPIWGGGADRP